MTKREENMTIKWKRIFLSFLAVLLLAGAMSTAVFAASSGSGKGKRAANAVLKTVKLNKKGITVKVGKTYQLKAVVGPKNAKIRKTTWKSSNPKVAAVSKKGKVTGKKPGKATITVICRDAKGKQKKASCKVTVKKKSSNPFKITYAKTKLKVGEVNGYSFNLDLDAPPKWSISDTSVLEFEDAELGYVRAIRTGTAKITCTGKYKKKKVSASVTVKVVKNSDNETNFYWREELVAKTRREVAAAKAKGPVELIKYCETHTKYVKYDYLNRSYQGQRELMSGSSLTNVDVSKEYQNAVDTLYRKWIRELLSKCHAGDTSDPLVKMVLFCGYVNGMYQKGELQYGARWLPYCLCPYVAPYLLEGSQNGKYQYGSCYAYAMLVRDAAKELGLNAGCITPSWNPAGADHLAGQIIIGGQEYIMDALWGTYQGQGSTAEARLTEACNKSNEIVAKYQH